MHLLHFIHKLRYSHQKFQFIKFNINGHIKYSNPQLCYIPQYLTTKAKDFEKFRKMGKKEIKI